MSNSEQRIFTFAFAPTIVSDSAEKATHSEPLRAFLERELDCAVRFIAPTSYAESIAKLRAGEVDAAMLGEVATRQGAEMGGIEPLVSPVGENEEIPTYRSAFVARIDSGIYDLADLRGREIGLVDEQSTSGYLVPRAMLRETGIDPDAEMTIRLFGRHRHVIEAVINGEVPAGAVHEIRLTPPSLGEGPDYARLRILARSRPIPLGPMVVRTSLDSAVRERLAEAMIRVHERDVAAANVLIRSGARFTMAKRPTSPTLKSIAALAGVSYATVSRVVNQQGYVAPKTAERVQAVIEELGYSPNGHARVLHGQQAPMIGLVTPFSAGDTDKLVADLAAVGVPLVLCPVVGRLADGPFLNVVRDRRLGALIVGPEHVDDPDLIQLSRTGHAVVALGVEVAPVGVVTASITDAIPAILRAIGWNGRSEP